MQTNVDPTIVPVANGSLCTPYYSGKQPSAAANLAYFSDLQFLAANHQSSGCTSNGASNSASDSEAAHDPYMLLDKIYYDNMTPSQSEQIKAAYERLNAVIYSAEPLEYLQPFISRLQQQVDELIRQVVDSFSLDDQYRVKFLADHIESLMVD